MIFYTTKATLRKQDGMDDRGRPIVKNIEIPQRCFVEETFATPFNAEQFGPLALLTGAVLIFAPGELVRDVSKGDTLELDEYAGDVWLVTDNPRHYKIGGWHTEIRVERSA